MATLRDTSSLQVTESTFEISIKSAGHDTEAASTTYWSDARGEGWRCGISTSSLCREKSRKKSHIHNNCESTSLGIALDLSAVDASFGYVILTAYYMIRRNGCLEAANSSGFKTMVFDYVITLPNKRPDIPYIAGTFSSDQLPCDILVTFKIAYPRCERIALPPSAVLIGRTLKSTMSSASFTDTKFVVYSRRRQSGRLDAPLPIFANSGFLKNVCPSYFEPLFSDTFAGSSSISANDYDHYSDSDLSDCDEAMEDDVDEVAESEGQGPQAIDLISATKEQDRDTLVRTIVVTDFAFRTYKALVYYLYTGNISFAPLKSQRDPTTASKETDTISVQEDELLCSPKSMYRLADKLGLDDLKRQAFAAIRSDLSDKNIVEEVGSKFTAIPEYDAIRQMEIQILLNKCAAPGVKKDLLALLKKTMLGELPHATDTLLSFMDNVIPAR